MAEPKGVRLPEGVLGRAESADAQGPGQAVGVVSAKEGVDAQR
jgi:hypothetical protein